MAYTTHRAKAVTGKHQLTMLNPSSTVIAPVLGTNHLRLDWIAPHKQGCSPKRVKVLSWTILPSMTRFSDAIS